MEIPFFLRIYEFGDEFSQHFLKPDGIILVKFIRQNAGGRVTADIVAELFKKYQALPPLAIPTKQEKLTDLDITYKSIPSPTPEIVNYEETPKRKFLQDLPLTSPSFNV
uniref:Uncharacterized protein n=1 Tax=Panagrolaimus sp. ES5 TaxID=591445 RepID=A0AC34F4E8_9BILA